MADESRQRQLLLRNSEDAGPQSPRNIDSIAGFNPQLFSLAPPREQMNLCNIHFHHNAEHAGGEFGVPAGLGRKNGLGGGYRYGGQLSDAERTRVNFQVCPGSGGSLQSGDTIELHYVFSTATVGPGAGLEACLNERSKNPQLRVESQVLALINDPNALDFKQLTRIDLRRGNYQAPGIPDFTGKPVEYRGSTTGPSYNTRPSPYQVSWAVRPKVAKVSIYSLAKWCKANPFGEIKAHGVRNLVTDPRLLSPVAP
ncbi:MAG: delta-class carbonic anhydrase [Cellvibrionaceae bacterium]|nr:delta-class carbonic anhydrase [Cellvibrionaceae bacterium]